VGEFLVLARHALRNAFIPILTLLGLQFGSAHGRRRPYRDGLRVARARPPDGEGRSSRVDYILLQGAVLSSRWPS